jgi:hypothetical protein
VLPTTYAGSKMTPILGETKDGAKTTQRSLKVLPEVVIYDVNLTLGLPPAIAATSGINAMAHAVEALYARDRNPVISLMAEEGIRSLARALPRIVEDSQDCTARADALYGAWLCGACLGSARLGSARLGSVRMALHHKLCQVLGGTFDLPHAETHAIVLPHAPAYNAPASPKGHGAHRTDYWSGRCRARPVRVGGTPGSQAGAARHPHAARWDQAGHQGGHGISLLEPAPSRGRGFTRSTDPRMERRSALRGIACPLDGCVMCTGAILRLRSSRHAAVVPPDRRTHNSGVSSEPFGSLRRIKVISLKKFGSPRGAARFSKGFPAHHLTRMGDFRDCSHQ